MVDCFWIAGFHAQVTLPMLATLLLQPGILFPSIMKVIRPA
jgi:hypothetical protein